MEITESARKHGVDDADIQHAFENAIAYAELEFEGEDRLLIIGADSTGRLLELIAVPVEGPERIIHADTLRKKFFDRLP